ncbi:MAG: O-antigen ligase family protein [bacterium]
MHALVLAKLSRWVQVLHECLFWLPVVLVPTVFTTFNTHTIVMKETVLQITTALLLLWLPLAISFESRNNPERTAPAAPKALALLLAGFAAYLIVSALGVSSHPRSTHELLRWLSYVLFAVAAYQFNAGRRRFRMFLHATVLVSAAISLYAILQAFEIEFFLDWKTFDFGGGFRRVTGSLGNPDYLAGYLAALLPLTLTLTLARRSWARLAFFMAALMQLAALVFSYSRGAWVATAATLMLLAASLTYVNWVRDPVLFQPVITRRGAVAVLAGMALLSVGLTIGLWEEISAMVLRFAQVEEDTSVATRPFFWKGAAAIWMSSPWVGTGLGTFPLYFPAFRPKELSFHLPFQEFFVEHAHNEYLETAAETGAIGLVSYLAVLVSVLVYVWRTLIRRRSRENLELLGLWSGMLGILIHNLFTVTLRFTPSAFLLWSFAGAAVGRSAALRASGEEPSSWIQGLFHLALMAFIPFLFLGGIRFFVGDSMIKNGIRWISELDENESTAFNRSRLEQTFTALNQARILAPDHPESLFYLGVAYHKVMDYQQAIEAFTALEQLQEDFTTNRLNLGISCLKEADLVGTHTAIRFPTLARDCLVDAASWLEKAIESDPNSPDYRYFAGRAYFYLGEFQKAEQYFLAALRLNQKRAFKNKIDSSGIQTFLEQIKQYNPSKVNPPLNRRP